MWQSQCHKHHKPSSTMVSGIGYNPSIPPSNGIIYNVVYDPKQKWLQQLVFQGWFMALGLPNGSNPYHCYLATRGDYTAWFIGHITIQESIPGYVLTSLSRKMGWAIFHDSWVCPNMTNARAEILRKK